eukprot:scaffold869_cov105-Isochrysis_galbana.AAC.45
MLGQPGVGGCWYILRLGLPYVSPQGRARVRRVWDAADVNVGVGDSERFEDANGVGDVEYCREDGVALDTACLAGQGMGLGGDSEGGGGCPR